MVLYVGNVGIRTTELDLKSLICWLRAGQSAIRGERRCWRGELFCICNHQ